MWGYDRRKKSARKDNTIVRVVRKQNMATQTRLTRDVRGYSEANVVKLAWARLVWDSMGLHLYHERCRCDGTILFNSIYSIYSHMQHASLLLLSNFPYTKRVPTVIPPRDKLRRLEKRHDASFLKANQGNGLGLNSGARRLRLRV